LATWRPEAATTTASTRSDADEKFKFSPPDVDQKRRRREVRVLDAKFSTPDVDEKRRRLLNADEKSKLSTPDVDERPFPSLLMCGPMGQEKLLSY
jgi:hypothetical protein